MLLTGEEGSGRQSSHASGKPAQGELALMPPFLGGSQRLLNADHYAVYYKVCLQVKSHSPKSPIPNASCKAVVNAVYHQAILKPSPRRQKPRP